MTHWHLADARRLVKWCAAAAMGAVVMTATFAATVSYTYDEHGRLKTVTYANDSSVVYSYDVAGNRTQANTITVPGVPSSISVPSSSSTGSFTVSWGAASGTVSSYELYEATNSSFSGQVLAYSGAGTSHAVSGKGPGTYYYRVRACNGSGCSAYRAGANGTTVTSPIQVLNPAITVGYTGQLTGISVLANLNGNSATIHSFSLSSCTYPANAGATIQSGAQSVRWTNHTYYYYQCEVGNDGQCSASYVIRNSGNGQLHNGSSVVTVTAQPQELPPGYQCP